MGYMKAEHLKFKHTMSNKLLWISPLMTAVFAWIVGGVYGFQYMTFYWWYTFLLPGTIAILCGISHRIEVRAGKYYSVLAMPVDLQKFEIAKAVVLIEKLLVSALYLALFASLNNVLAPTLAVYSLEQCVVGSIGIILVSAWQIPMCFILMRKAGIFLPVMVSSIFSIFSPITLGNTVLWWLWPYCWAAKYAESVMGIQINGTYAHTPAFSGTFLVTLGLSFLLFVVLAFCDISNFLQEEGK